MNKCSLRGCNKRVKPPQTLYCSREHAKIANRARASERAKRLSAEAKSTRVIRTRRVCLACERSFMSEGIWNRICPSCTKNQPSYAARRYSARVILPSGANLDVDTGRCWRVE